MTHRLPARVPALALPLVWALGLTACTPPAHFQCPLTLVPLSAPSSPSSTCPLAQPYPFTNLAFQGGGVKGVAYGGALEVLDQQGILPGIERVAGTSAGAITAALVALRYTPAEIRQIMISIDFTRFEDGGDDGVPRMVKKFGWFGGDYFLDLMRCLVEQKTGKPRTTFADLAAGGFRDLHVFSTDLANARPREFSAAISPGFEVALAVRMSMSIPLFFASVADGDAVYVDGGVLNNYPIDTFDSRTGVNPDTLGFVLENTAGKPVDHSMNDLPQYAAALFSTLLQVQVDALAESLPDLERTVVLDDLGIKTTDFSLSQEQKQALIDKGVDCTCSYLTAWRGFQDRGIKPKTILELRGGGRCGMVVE